MKIDHRYPPNFATIAAAIPAARRPGVIFAYEDTIFAPTSGGPITPHLIAHEKVHGERQKAQGVEQWWNQYLVDLDFRYNEELLAHRAEYQSMISDAPNRQQRRACLKMISKRLASSLYGCGRSAEKCAADILEGIE